MYSGETKVERKREIKQKLLEKYRRYNRNPALVETDASPANAKLKLFNAVLESKTAEIELGVKQILLPMKNLDLIQDWTDLKIWKKDLQKQFINSNKTIKDNKASLARFHEIIRDKTVDKKALETQMEDTKTEIKAYKDVKTEMENYVNEYTIYENFLLRVVRDSENFHSVGDILNHYESLEHTRKETTRLLKEGLEEATLLRRALTALVEEKTEELKNLRNKLTTMQHRKKRAKENLGYWDQTVFRMKRLIDAREEDRIAQGAACYDLYRAMCGRRGVHVSAGERDMDAQMNFIRKTIVFYKEVTTIATSVKQARLTAAKSKISELTVVRSRND